MLEEVSNSTTPTVAEVNYLRIQVEYSEPAMVSRSDSDYIRITVQNEMFELDPRYEAP